MNGGEAFGLTYLDWKLPVLLLEHSATYCVQILLLQYIYITRNGHIA